MDEHHSISAWNLAVLEPIMLVSGLWLGNRKSTLWKDLSELDPP